MGIHIFCAATLMLTTPTMESDMSFHRPHFEELIRNTLVEHDLDSDAAVNLLMGTAAVESNFGTYLKQLHRGPALGVFQMEPATFDWLAGKYPDRVHPAAVDRDMIHDLKFAILMARLRYLVVPEALPPADDIDALGAYWKSYYNTFAGNGSVRGWIEAWDKYLR